ncbi:hypothetical protein HanHA300_Chr15g0571211 [Helianthus annuus]|nr:hypothetical protein HanHA300_Chr15g0571211 [Helianthus annuus]KAJ0473642.1 hypothetical protein HanHA89_Chr15g0620681 [Helianthus annuus]KAJ0649219.1 hypothetical protein HanLR1_Chr15g0581781 [Helianthus annuus]KAJ0653019.1 hypothetical protein HanOQP8_Chr15g0578791 [Helianthus annuus]
MPVSEAFAWAGLKSSKLIFGIDFTKTSEWTDNIIVFESFFFNYFTQVVMVSNIFL